MGDVSYAIAAITCPPNVLASPSERRCALPGERTHEHRHPPFVLYAVAPFKRKLLLPDGKELIREFKAGDVMWSDAQTHIGVNVGETPTWVIMIEMK
jgi:hypothetical protein